MSEAAFFRPNAKDRAKRAVETVEAQTSAELVVALRRKSGDYRLASYHFGFVLLAVVLIQRLVSSELFTLSVMAADALGAFLLGVVACRYIGGLTRLLVGGRQLRANVETAARAAFYDLGMTKTRDRTGILVFVSTFERHVAVLPDIGVDMAALEPGFSTFKIQMQQAVRGARPEDLFDRLENLGQLLAPCLPRADDDENELPDEVR
jgi:putative membrane protein